MPFISPRVRNVFIVLSPMLLAVGSILPAPVGPLLGILSFVMGGLAGLAMDAPRWVVTAKAYIPASMTASAVTFAMLLESVAEGQAAGPVQLAMRSCALLLTFLAGHAAPAPQLPTDVQPPVDKALSPGVSVDVDAVLAAGKAANVNVDVAAEDRAA